MTRLILRLINTPLLILMTVIGIALQTSLFQSWPLNYLQPDLVLIVVIWCALKRGFIEGGVITLIIADMAEVHSATPQGLYLVAYMTVYLLIRGAARVLVIPHLSSYLAVTIFASIVWKMSGLAVLHLLGTGTNQWRHTLALLFPGALVEGGVGFWFYRWLDRYDWITFKNARAEQLLDEELQLDSDGLT